jgi:hypothetical protein
VLAASIIALMTEAAGTSETLVNFYQTTRRYNPEDSHLLLSNVLKYLYQRLHVNSVAFTLKIKTWFKIEIVAQNV